MLTKIASAIRPSVLRERITKTIFTIAKPTVVDVEVAPTKKEEVEAVRIATMDDLPVPCGSWTEYNTKRQQKYNKILLVGILSMVMSLAVLQNSEGAKLLTNMQYIEGFDYDVPSGAWIGRYMHKERTFNRYFCAGLGLATVSVVALVKSNSLWLGQNFQHICGFKYQDSAKPKGKTKPETENEKKRRYARECGGILEESEKSEQSAVPFTVLALVFTIATLIKFFL